jgi:hypothetical protein
MSDWPAPGARTAPAQPQGAGAAMEKSPIEAAIEVVEAIWAAHAEAIYTVEARLSATFNPALEASLTAEWPLVSLPHALAVAVGGSPCALQQWHGCRSHRSEGTVGQGAYLAAVVIGRSATHHAIVPLGGAACVYTVFLCAWHSASCALTGGAWRVACRHVMRSRGPCEGPLLQIAMVTYNVVQVVLCMYMAAEASRQFYLLDYTLLCNNPRVVAETESFEPTGMSQILWVFYLSKVLDFCDTLFIVLRKKDVQLSFLHVFHHTSIFLVYYLQVRPPRITSGAGWQAMTLHHLTAVAHPVRKAAQLSRPLL